MYYGKGSIQTVYSYVHLNVFIVIIIDDLLKRIKIESNNKNISIWNNGYRSLTCKLKTKTKTTKTQQNEPKQQH